MAKKQTRRSVSIRGTTYEKIRIFCERKNISMSEFVEERIAEFFGETTPEKQPDARSRPIPKAPEKQKAAPAAPAAQKKGNGGDGTRLDFDQLQDAARYFTF